jgi:hypothetical protein
LSEQCKAQLGRKEIDDTDRDGKSDRANPMDPGVSPVRAMNVPDLVLQHMPPTWQTHGDFISDAVDVKSV